MDWSPDGQHIVYARAKGGYNDLYIYDVKHDEERRISANLRSKDPAFSPDGERVAYVHNEDGTNNLAMVNSDGTGRVYLTNNNDGTQYSRSSVLSGRRVDSIQRFPRRGSGYRRYTRRQSCAPRAV